MRHGLFILFFSFISATVSAVDFTKISRLEPVSTAYPATFKSYVDVSLFLNVEERYNNPIHLRVIYIIGNDTLSDNLVVNGTVNKVVKQLFLDEGERVTVQIFLNNSDIELIDNIEGSLRIVRNPDFQPTKSSGKTSFLSNVWKSDQTPLFRLNIKDSIPQLFRLKLSLNENYEFDVLHLKLKVISPSAGIVMLEKSLAINETNTVAMRKRNFDIDISEIDLATAGTYYFQVMSNMAYSRLNGVEKVDYEIVPE